MPTVAELVRIVAQVLELPDKEVALYARRLREAKGLLPQSRGRRYPRINYKHCARLLVSLLAAENARSAAAAVRNHPDLIGRMADILADLEEVGCIGSLDVRRNSGFSIINYRRRHKDRPRSLSFHGRRGSPRTGRIDISARIFGVQLLKIAKEIHGSSGKLASG